MRVRDTIDVLYSGTAVVADAVAIAGGFMLAVWLRFDSGLLHPDSRPPDLYLSYGIGALVATLLFLFLFRSLQLYVRPQLGTFAGKIPRLIRAIGLGILLTTALAFAVRTEPPISRLTVLIAFGTILALVVVERFILFRLEVRFARGRNLSRRILIIGTDSVAAHLRRGLEADPRLRSRVVGFIRTREDPGDLTIPAYLVRGSLAELESILDTHPADQIILTDSNIGHQRVLEIILACDRNLIIFNMVPDMFRIMTGSIDMQTIDDIPLLGVSRWPLDYFWNRTLKRAEDMTGAFLGLVLIAPLIGLVAILIKRSSPGPVFYKQKRCGENGRQFSIYKFRTMRQDAEKESGPVWTVENDPRRTRLGTFLRTYNIDELPQLWNVLRGDMSLVGPRPERPHFVEKFKNDIDLYMRRHVSKPGMTGWAQVNGLRGNTSIEERIKYDLYYLEHWSLSFDFKILIRTLSAHKNAY